MTTNAKSNLGSVSAVWDDQAASYETERQADPVYLSCIRQVTASVPEGTELCLDVGCGTGLSTVELSQRCEMVVAVDYSFESLKILKAKGLANVFVVQANLTALPLKTSAFDACVCANTLQHLRPNGPQECAVIELNRVTVDGGVLSVSVHHYSDGKRRAGWIKEGKPGQAGIDYIFRFSASDLQSMFPYSTIKGIGYYGLTRVPYLGSRLQNLFARAFGRLAARFGFGHMLIASATKRNRCITEISKLS